MDILEAHGAATVVLTCTVLEFVRLIEGAQPNGWARLNAMEGEQRVGVQQQVG